MNLDVRVGGLEATGLSNPRRIGRSEQVLDVLRDLVCVDVSLRVHIELDRDVFFIVFAGAALIDGVVARDDDAQNRGPRWRAGLLREFVGVIPAADQTA